MRHQKPFIRLWSFVHNLDSGFCSIRFWMIQHILRNPQKRNISFPSFFSAKKFQVCISSPFRASKAFNFSAESPEKGEEKNRSNKTGLRPVSRTELKSNHIDTFKFGSQTCFKYNSNFFILFKLISQMGIDIRSWMFKKTNSNNLKYFWILKWNETLVMVDQILLQI